MIGKEYDDPIQAFAIYTALEVEADEGLQGLARNLAIRKVAKTAAEILLNVLDESDLIGCHLNPTALMSALESYVLARDGTEVVTVDESTDHQNVIGAEPTDDTAFYETLTEAVTPRRT